MASTYVNDLRLNEMATGDQSGSWGTVTNTNLELIGEAFSYGTEAITTNADTHATTIADGAYSRRQGNVLEVHRHSRQRVYDHNRPKHGQQNVVY
jgi:hypothetical protein